jgi:stalled ribosome alternative rescue factor ArfA
MKVTPIDKTSTKYKKTRNPFALQAKKRKAGIEKAKKGRGSYVRKEKHLVSIEV